jgi:glucose/arabinose dehydrogenase
MIPMMSVALHRPLVLALALTVGACGSSTKGAPPSGSPGTPAPPADPQPPTNPPPPVPTFPEIQVNGDERIGWDQEITTSTAIGDYRFSVYVDGRGSPLPGVTCDAQPGPQGYLCSAPLPPLTDGRHTLNITAVRKSSSAAGEGESPRSVRLTVVKGAASLRLRKSAAILPGAAPMAPPAARGDSPARPPVTVNGERLQVQDVIRGLGSVADLAALPDGRILVAENAGRIRVLAGDVLQAEPLVVLADVAPGSGGLVSIAVHPLFAANHLLYILYAADRGGRAVYSITRGREVNGRLGEIAVLMDAAAADAQAAGAIRFGSDGKLYVALPSAAEPGNDSAASLLGKVLRLNDDGTTPADNPRASPVYSSGHGLTLGLASDLTTGRMFDAEKARTGLVHALLSDADYGAAGGRAQPVADLGPGALPAGILVYSGAAFPAWRGQILVARYDGAGIDRVDSGAGSVHSFAELGREYGRIRALVEGLEGSIYFGTANGPATSVPDQDVHDRIARITPAPHGTGATAVPHLP